MREYIFFDEQVHEIPAWQVLHHQVQVLRVLKRALEPHHPGVILRVRQHISLLSGLHNFVLEDHLALFQLLNGHRLSCFSPFAEPHLAKSPLAHDLHRREVPDAYFNSILPQNRSFLVQYFLLDLFLFLN